MDFKYSSGEIPNIFLIKWKTLGEKSKNVKSLMSKVFLETNSYTYLR